MGSHETGDRPSIVPCPDEAVRDHPGDRISAERRAVPVRVQSYGGLGGREQEPKLHLADGGVEAHLVRGVAFSISDCPVVERNLLQRGIVPGHAGNVPMEAFLALGGVFRPIEQCDVRTVDCA